MKSCSKNLSEITYLEDVANNGEHHDNGDYFEAVVKLNATLLLSYIFMIESARLLNPKVLNCRQRANTLVFVSDIILLLQ